MVEAIQLESQIRRHEVVMVTDPALKGGACRSRFRVPEAPTVTAFLPPTKRASRHAGQRTTSAQYTGSSPRNPGAVALGGARVRTLSYTGTSNAGLGAPASLLVQGGLFSGCSVPGYGLFV